MARRECVFAIDVDNTDSEEARTVSLDCCGEGGKRKIVS